MSQKQNNQSRTPERPPMYFDAPIEVRAAQQAGGPIRIFGYSALFNVRSREMRTSSGKRFVEVILPGAFDGVNDADCDCRYDHYVFLSSKGNYRSGVDERGRWYEYDHDPNDPDHVSVLAKIRRGECKGSSFMFDEPDVTDQTVTREGPVLVRHIKRFAKMWDEGPVRKPAYRQTTVSVRSIDEFDTDIAEPETESRDMGGAYDANTNPSDAQKEAGNYKKGKVRVHGMDISIENPKDSERSGTAPDGKAWRTVMRAHYGYILGSLAGDGDNLDVFLSDAAESARVAWVVDQVNPADGSFDELKCLIGPATEQEARALYLSHYEEGWTGLASICYVPMECFRAWALDGKPKRSPLGVDTAKLYGPVLEAGSPEMRAEAGPEKPEVRAEAEAEAGAETAEAKAEGAEVKPEVTEARAEADPEPDAAKQQVIERRKLELRRTLI